MESKANLGEWVYYIAKGTSSYFYHIPTGNHIVAKTDLIQADAFQVIEYNNQIYIMGGNIKNEALNSCFILSISPYKLNIKRKFNIPRWAFGCCKSDRYIFILGGYNGAKCLQEVEQYDPAKDMWTYLPSMIEGKTSCGACFNNNKLYAFGGFKHKFGFVGIMEILDLKVGKEWTKSLLPTKFGSRSACATITLPIDSTKILVFGGMRSSTEFHNDSWVYDINTKEIYGIDAKLSLTDYFSCCSNNLGFKSDGKLYAVGSETMNIHIFDAKESSWKMIAKDKWIS